MNQTVLPIRTTASFVRLRRCSRTPCAGRVGVELSIPGSQDQTLEMQGAGGTAGRQGHRLGGPDAPMRTVSASVSRGRGEVRGHHRGGARAGGIHLGHRLRGDGPTPCDARCELNDGPEFSTPCPPLRQCSRHAAPWTRRGELRRRLRQTVPPSERAKQFIGKCNVLESGRGRPVRRILVDPMRGLPRADQPTPVD